MILSDDKTVLQRRRMILSDDKTVLQRRRMILSDGKTVLQRRGGVLQSHRGVPLMNAEPPQACASPAWLGMEMILRTAEAQAFGDGKWQLAPTVSVHNVPKDRVRMLNVRITENAAALLQRGAGTRNALDKNTAVTLPAKQ